MAQHLRRNNGMESRMWWRREVALGEESVVPPLTGRRHMWAVQTDLCRVRGRLGRESRVDFLYFLRKGVAEDFLAVVELN